MTQVLLPPARLKRQPQQSTQVDWLNPLTSRLIYAMNHATGVDEVSGPGATTDIGTMARAINSKGVGIAGLNAIRSVGFQAEAEYRPVVNGPMTQMGVVRIKSVDLPWGGVFAFSDASGNALFSFQRRDTTNDFSAYRDNQASHAFSTDTILLLSDGLPHVWCVTSESSVLGSVGCLYIDGTLVSTQPLTFNYTRSGSQVVGPVRAVYFGERAATTSYGSDGEYIAHFAWSRALSAHEVRALSGNPWQLFTGPRRTWAAIGNAAFSRTLNASLNEAAARQATIAAIRKAAAMTIAVSGKSASAIRDAAQPSSASFSTLRARLATLVASLVSAPTQTRAVSMIRRAAQSTAAVAVSLRAALLILMARVGSVALSRKAIGGTRTATSGVAGVLGKGLSVTTSTFVTLAAFGAKGVLLTLAVGISLIALLKNLIAVVASSLRTVMIRAEGRLWSILDERRQHNIIDERRRSDIK